MSFLVRTNTTRFILPLTGISKENLITPNFVNAYLHLDCWPERRGIFVAYKGDNTALADYHLKISNGELTIYLLDMLIAGRYSKIPSATKTKILRFWELGTTSNLYFILYPDVFYNETGYGNILAGRKPETWPPFVLKHETLSTSASVTT